MPLAAESAGTLLAGGHTVGGTPTVLASPTTGKTRILNVDLTNMAPGDIIVLRIWYTLVSGGANRIFRTVTIPYSVAVGEPGSQGHAVAQLYGGSFTLQQTAGTARAFDWSIWTL